MEKVPGVMSENDTVECYCYPWNGGRGGGGGGGGVGGGGGGSIPKYMVYNRPMHWSQWKTNVWVLQAQSKKWMEGQSSQDIQNGNCVLGGEVYVANNYLSPLFQS